MHHILCSYSADWVRWKGIFMSRNIITFAQSGAYFDEKIKVVYFLIKIKQQNAKFNIKFIIQSKAKEN
jgi:hypothetical protein